jgi:type II secretory pathway pseudopilin PulG
MITSSPSRRRGFALVAVLAVLVLLLVLALGFFLRASTERTAAASHQEGVSAELLADTVVDLVKGQVHMATTQGQKVAWASQPGMVRTYNDSGNLVKAYKLYSAETLIADTPGVTNGESADLPTTSWANDKALWTDLNAPIPDGAEKIFPILDPGAAGDDLDDAADNPIAEGFRIVNAPGSTTWQPAPMPVRWLYMLSDGSLVAPTGGSGNTASVPVPEGKEILGRVAFWTDDDTNKVNLNTASEGTYWDTPRFNTTFDRNTLAHHQPARNEWQTYPGHPANTSLSAVFPTLTRTQIYDLAPRVVGGGSENGTLLATAALTADSDRLYATVDESIFTSDRDDYPSLTQTQLAQSPFFLTTHSRAPETNLFDLPRIATWPIFQNMPAARITVFDKLIAFCSSTGDTGSLRPYYFQRADALSPTADISISRNEELYEYLQHLTKEPVPGFGGRFTTKYPSDRNQILTEIFDYIRSTNLYDFLLDINQRYTPYRNWIAGLGWVTPSVKGDTMGIGRAYTLSEFGLQFICNAVADNPATTGTDESAASNQVTGNSANRILGGTPLAAGEKSIQAMTVMEFFSPALGWSKLLPSVTVKISGLETLTVTSGTVTTPLFPVLTGTDAAVQYFENTSALPDNSGGGPLVGGRAWGGTPGTRFFVFRKGSPARGGLAADAVVDGEDGTAERTGGIYPFIGNPIRIPAPTSGGTMDFSGGTVTVEIFAGQSSAMLPSDLIQTLNINMPAATIPIPELVTGNNRQRFWTFTKAGTVNTYNGRLYYGQQPVFNAADVVRTVVPRHGDYRLIAASRTVPDTVFVPPNDLAYKSSTIRLAHNFTQSFASNFEPGFLPIGNFLTGVTFPVGKEPDLPADTAISPGTTGDFDGGLPTTMDGPFINKPDEGNANLRNAPTKIPYFDMGDSNWTNNMGDDEKTFSAPNRQVASAGMFGSLPTGVKSGAPWQTLLFRPQASHPSHSTTIPDHLFLDLFWMPVVEPYALSDRFSTAGKINLNHQILPFTYLKRPTALRALLKAEKLIAIPNDKASVYKATVEANQKASAASGDQYRLDFDATKTLEQLDDSYFNDGKIFRSASEICDIPIIPVGQTASGMTAFWADHALTADNLRERIYTTLYPRLTTKSNTYTVHYRVQTLKKNRNTGREEWDESRDIVRSEQRGSITIERFIDANDPNIPDYAADPENITKTLGDFYRWRTVASRKY